MEWNYELYGNLAGKVNLSIQITVKDPFIKNYILNYKKKLGVLNLLDT